MQTLHFSEQASAPVPSSLHDWSLFGPSVHLHAPLMQRRCVLQVSLLLLEPLEPLLLPPLLPPLLLELLLVLSLLQPPRNAHAARSAPTVRPVRNCMDEPVPRSARWRHQRGAIMSSGRTEASNSASETRPEAIAASLRVMSFSCAFFAIDAAAS